ncbi:type II secretion system GspH family protein [Patescibacteria group bacterium]|nr:type II secretion system GspH family protein [Patescibacteria group bacterium]MBU1682794.1 type II secretion system GspH family protein [Patescibacteria group bacterium]MBU1935397.1 type II secretion system GspH family protein [Patescibacteria group bacterium]
MKNFIKTIRTFTTFTTFRMDISNRLHPNSRNSLNNLKSPNNKGFTLIELIIVMGFFGFLSAIVMQNLFSVYHFKEVIRYKKDINFETSIALNNGIPGLVRSGFAINYADTIESNSNQPSEGINQETDKISIFSDRAETQYFTIYREPYTSSGDNGDTARLMIAFSNGDAFPLHSSETVIEDFDIEVPADPRVSGDRDLQPYVQIYVRARHRYPFGEAADENELMAYQTVRASYQTTYTLRNTLPSSYKNNI